jgi:nitrilase
MGFQANSQFSFERWLPRMIPIAAVQMASGPNVNANLNEAARLISQTAQAGARLVVLPENFALMGMTEHDKLAVCEAEGQGPIQEFLSQQAMRHGIWLVGGTIPLRAEAPDKVRAACLLYNDQGRQVARYDKIHLFDVSLSDKAEDRYVESASIEAGNQVVVVPDTPVGRLGLAVCYDLRFPELFRGMVNQRVDCIALPSAFTAFTGRAHWEVLVRARAIENLCYVIAANQGGYHVNGRETYGDSMIVDPWGIILARLPRNSGIIGASLDPERLKQLRGTFPTLEHRRIGCQTPPDSVSRH